MSVQYQCLRTQNNDIGFVDKLFSRIDVFSQIGRWGNNFEIVTGLDSSSNLQSRRTGFSVDKDLVLVGEKSTARRRRRSEGGWSKSQNAWDANNNGCGNGEFHIEFKLIIKLIIILW